MKKLILLFTAGLFTILFCSCAPSDEYKEAVGAADKKFTPVLGTLTETNELSQSINQGDGRYEFHYTGTGGNIYFDTDSDSMRIYGIKVGNKLWNVSNAAADTTPETNVYYLYSQKNQTQTYSTTTNFVSNGITFTGIVDDTSPICVYTTLEKIDSTWIRNFGATIDGIVFTHEMHLDHPLKITVDSPADFVIYARSGNTGSSLKIKIEEEKSYELHDHDRETEGYFIPAKYWNKGSITEENKYTGDLWSFEAKAGVCYSLYMAQNHWSVNAFRGTSKSSFSLNRLENERGYNDLYKLPAAIQTSADETVYLKFLGDGNFTGDYDFCIREGRTGNKYVELKYYGVPQAAWTEGELLFAINNGLETYNTETQQVEQSNWYDYYRYSFDVVENQNYTLYLDTKDEGSGRYNAAVDLCLYYLENEDDEFLTPYTIKSATFENCYTQGIPVKAKKTGKMWVLLYPHNENASNTGTYRLAVLSEDSYCPLTKDYEQVKYQYLPDSRAGLAVGILFNPTQVLKLKKYDGTVVSADDIQQWGWSGSTISRLDSFLMLNQTGNSYIYVTYNDVDYYSYFRIFDKSVRPVTIGLPDDLSKFAVGNIVSVTAAHKGTDISTNDGVWYWANADEAEEFHVNIDDGEVTCLSEGESYIIANNPGTPYYAFEKVEIKSAGENPYSVVLDSGETNLFGSATFKLTKNGTDVSSGAVWSCGDGADFNSETHTATFYSAGVTVRIYAEFEGIKAFYDCVIPDAQTYNLTFDMPLDKVVFGASCSSVNLSGTYDSQKFNSLVTKLEAVTNSFTLDMSSVTGITTLNKPSEDSNDGVFAGCQKLTSLILPDSLISLGVSSLRNCTSIVSVTMPEGIETIGNYVFSGCTALKTVTIPNGLTTIGDSVFYGCSSLTSVTIPSSVTTIGRAMFGNCTSLTSMSIPDTVTSLDASSMFTGCTNLADFSLPSCVTSYSSTFTNCRSLTTVTIPNNITEIGSFTFDGCSKLSSVSFSMVQTIGKFAFRDCTSLTAITIPYSTTSIGKYAFTGCTNLTRAVFKKLSSNIWYYTSTDNATSGGTSLGTYFGANYTIAATSLTSTYTAYHWYKQ